MGVSQRGSIPYKTSGGQWDNLPTPANGHVLMSAGGDPIWTDLPAIPPAGLAYLTATQVFDPASLANAASASVSVTVPGAAVGDPASAGFTSIVAAGWRLTANVIAANTVSVFLTNNTGGTVNLPSGTLRIVVLKP